MSPWIASPRYDIVWFAGPAFLGTALALALPSAPMGTVGWLLLIVAVDVAHTWATLFRTYADPEGRRTWPTALLVCPLLALTAATFVASAAPAAFWSVLAYIAVFHFIRQQAGFTALYRTREGLSPYTWEGRLERAAIHAACLGPILWWHANLPREFAWFQPGDFVSLPTWVGRVALAAAVVLALAHVVTRVASRRWSPGRDLWMASTYASWWTGIVLTNSDTAFTVANVLAHGIAYFALVRHVTRPSPSAPGPSLLLLLAAPVALALGEELAWDAAVWREHAFLGTAPTWITAVALPVLAVPQLTHYLLDGVIWKRTPALTARLR